MVTVAACQYFTIIMRICRFLAKNRIIMFNGPPSSLTHQLSRVLPSVRRRFSLKMDWMDLPWRSRSEFIRRWDERCLSWATSMNKSLAVA